MAVDRRWYVLVLVICFATLSGVAEKKKQKGNKQGGNKDWNQTEYSGERTEGTIRMALSSKAFSWLSGSPADNEKLSVGKTAQFFGFVALRYQSGRAAQRGALGRAFMELATDEQQSLLLKAVHEEHDVMLRWWDCRSQILRLLEQHLYTGEPFDEVALKNLSKEFGYLNSKSALIEARAFATLEDLLSPTQLKTLNAIRENPDLANQKVKGQKRKKISGLSKDQAAQFEDLFAKCFSWLTGSMKDNEIVPLGQPAQFFGFVSIRHKSGHGASRGQISKSFREILNSSQTEVLDRTVEIIQPWVQKFMELRKQLLLEMQKLRDDPKKFDLTHYDQLSRDLGVVEVNCGMIEAQTYHKIRSSFNDQQLKEMMEIRSNYVIDHDQMEQLTLQQRGEKLYNLCASCHNKTVAPLLDGVYGRAIAADKNYEYSAAMGNYKKMGEWTSQRLDEFLEEPTKVIPGTKMTFQGLLNPDDRKAIIEYLKRLED